MRWFDWLPIVLVFLAATGARQFTGGETPHQPDNPRRPSASQYESRPWDRETRDWLNVAPGLAGQTLGLAPSPPVLPLGIIEAETGKGSSVGSAFSISADGVWLTARHVAEGCAKIWLGMEQGGQPVRRAVLHPQADIAVLVTDSGRLPLSITDSDGPVRVAYNIGFPAGQPGAVDAQFLGEMTLWHKGRNGYRERVFAWSERNRIPVRDGSLGGLSGGAVLNSSGQIIGVVQAESPRRGRIMTAMPQRLREIISLAMIDVPAFAVPQLTLGPDSFPATARDLILSVRVAKVFCRV